MLAYGRPHRKMLPTPVHLQIHEDVDFMKAQRIAKDQAKAYHKLDDM